MGGLLNGLTPEQLEALRAISEANTANLLIGLGFVILAVFGPMLFYIVRFTAQNRKQSHDIELKHIETENARDEATQSFIKSLQEMNRENSTRFSVAIEKLAEELRGIRGDQHLDIEDVRAGVASIPLKIEAQNRPVFDKNASDHQTIISGIGEAKTGMQALIQGQTEILSKLAMLPEDVKAAVRMEIDKTAAQVTLAIELLTNQQTSLLAIRNEIAQHLPMPDVDKVPPKTETSLPTLAADLTGATA